VSNILFWYIIYVWLYGVGQVDSERKHVNQILLVGR
jgi:hypothetical protein